ncbi:DNA replication/repair protein RecF [Stomatohabitans albus]|uniref:DNA replication/repair protein RecF n=1 Tax=Stomatohabitans albus TaxID=3110766 RepID=UPI00300CF45F
MYLSKLGLTDVRNHQATQLTLGPGPVVVSGANAQGKTNLVEAIHYLGVGSSHRTSNDRALIRQSAERALIRAEAVTDAQARLVVTVELNPGKNRAAVNDVVVPSMGEAIGLIRMVMLAPEDIALVRGEPNDRRRFLDQLLGSRRASYKGVLADADKALRQRNALLKDARGQAIDEDVLAAYTETWLHHAALVTAARIAGVNALAAPLIEAYGDLVSASPSQDVHRLPTLDYVMATGERITAHSDAALPSARDIQDQLQAALMQKADDERRRGVTLVGPQRDDLFIRLGELPAKDFASHGELWSLALGLKLATVGIIAETGDQPILILDDVFAELDQYRAERLAQRCVDFDQVIMTVATGTPVPVDAPTIMIEGGQVLL